jgi:hypothetical protein
MISQSRFSHNHNNTAVRCDSQTLVPWMHLKTKQSQTILTDFMIHKISSSYMYIGIYCNNSVTDFFAERQTFRMSSTVEPPLADTCAKGHLSIKDTKLQSQIDHFDLCNLDTSQLRTAFVSTKGVFNREVLLYTRWGSNHQATSLLILISLQHCC